MANVFNLRNPLFTVMMSRGVVSSGGGGGSCPDQGSPSLQNDGATPQAFGGGNIRFGQSSWNDGGVSRSICMLGFKLTKAGGASIVGSTFQAAIWTMGSPSYDLGTQQAISTGVPGDDAWNLTWVYFTFSTPFVTGGTSTPYALVVGPSVALSGNDMFGYDDNTALVGYRDVWNATNNASFATGNDAAIKIYWQ